MRKRGDGNTKTEKEIAKKARERAKRQNERAKETWETVSCRLPKGTKEAVLKNGETMNGIINKLLSEWLVANESK